MRLINFASGSRGNCTLLSSGDQILIIDCGISLRSLLSGLKEVGISVSDIDLVLITHLHNDHFKGFAKWYSHLPLAFAIPLSVIGQVAGTLGGKLNPRRIVTFAPYNTLRLGDMSITLFPLPHDAAETVGVNVSINDKSISYLTDLGSFNDDLLQFLENQDAIFLEANHEVELVKNSRYPESVKRRILSPNGHLSNKQAISLVSSLKYPPEMLIFGHLSENNNSPSLVMERVGNSTMSHSISVIDFAFQGKTTQFKF